MVTRTFTTLAAAVSLMIGAAQANAQSQQGWLVAEPGVACDGHDGAGHGTVYHSPPSDLPPLPWKIVAVAAWWIGQVPSGAGGTVGLQFDKGSAYVNFTGYPNSQIGSVPIGNTVQDKSTLYHSVTPLIPIITITPYSQQYSYRVVDPPVVWNVGDSIYSGYSCAGGGGVQMGWAIYFENN